MSKFGNGHGNVKDWRFLKFLIMGEPLQTTVNGGEPLQTAKWHSLPFASD